MQNEAEVTELETLIDTLQQVKEIYASGESLERDKRFRYLFKKFFIELKDIDVTKIQSVKDKVLSLMIS